jgi:hypothetical protein
MEQVGTEDRGSNPDWIACQRRVLCGSIAKRESIASSLYPTAVSRT